MLAPLSITASVVIPAAELSWSAARSSGPGGQNVNKVASKVELRFDLASTRAISAGARARLRALAINRLDAEGRIRIVSQRTRDQGRNLEDAREKLAALIRAALVEPRERRATKPTRASKRRRVEAKQHVAQKKRLRRSVAGED